MFDTSRKLSKTDIEIQSLIDGLFTWNARNQFLCQGKKLNPLILAATAEEMEDAYKRVKRSIQTKRGCEAQAMDSPPTGCCKVNVNAAANMDNHIVSLGVVMREGWGAIVAAAIIT